jgi:hypothetical protein
VLSRFIEQCRLWRAKDDVLALFQRSVSYVIQTNGNASGDIDAQACSMEDEPQHQQAERTYPILGSVAKNKKGGAPLYFSEQILKCQILSGVISGGS